MSQFEISGLDYGRERAQVRKAARNNIDMDKLIEAWRASRQRLKDELDAIQASKLGTGEGDQRRTDASATTRELVVRLRKRIAELDALIGAKRNSRDA